MLWNALVMLVASLGSLWGVREGLRYALLSGLDLDLRQDFEEVALALTNVFDARNPFFQAQMARKARGHVQQGWFIQFIDARKRPEKEADEENRRGGELVQSAEENPRIIWQSINVPDWSSLGISPNFQQLNIAEGILISVHDFRILEQTVPRARRGPVRVRIGASVRSIEHASAVTDRLVLTSVFASLVVAPLGGYWLALRATRPLNTMIQTTDRLRPQQMQERLPIRNTGDEIDQLSAAFNRLLDRIGEYLVKRQDFLANSAHELRTPLAALRSTAEMALSTPRSSQEYCETLELIVSECGNLELLVTQLLLLAETDAAHFEDRGEVVDLSRITNEACEMFGAAAESRGVELSKSIAPGVVVHGSRGHLRQLLNNLIDNAIKFIPNRGQVTVELISKVSGSSLHVRDNGVGIDPKEQMRLFERFYRGDRARRRDTPSRGTGLGLSICKSIAEAHGGAITIRSQAGVGTEVQVDFPPSEPGKSKSSPAGQDDA